MSFMENAQLFSGPSAPDALNATQGTDEGSIILEWDHPVIANGVINKYEVIYWKCDENEKDDSIDISLSGDATNVEITLLEPGFTYNMRVGAHGRVCGFRLLLLFKTM